MNSRFAYPEWVRFFRQEVEELYTNCQLEGSLQLVDLARREEAGLYSAFTVKPCCTRAAIAVIITTDKP